MRRPALPPRLAAALVLGLLPLAGCGDDPKQAIRLEILGVALDGAVPEDLALRRLAEGAPAEAYPLRRAEDQAATFMAVGAPAGTYALEAPQGWGLLAPGAVPPLEPGRDPIRLRLGRSHSVYVVPDAPGVLLADGWALQRVGEGGAPGPPVAVREERHQEGRMVALRVPPEAWHGSAVVLGHLAAGDMSDFAAVHMGPDERPRLARVKGVETRALDVVLVPTRPDQDLDGLGVAVRVLDVPLDLGDAIRVRSGRARASRLPLLGRDLEVRVDGGEALRLAYEPWLWEPGLYLLAPPGEGEPVRRLSVRIGQERVPERVHVRPEGLATYGLVPFQVGEGGTLTFRAPSAAFHLRVQAREAWTEPILVGPDEEQALEPTWVRASTVRVRVDGTQGLAVVRLLLREGEDEVLAQGLALWVGSGPGLEARVPPGTYAVEIEAASAPLWRRPAPLDVSRPGVFADLTLRPDR